jgi:hypothetical protein
MAKRRTTRRKPARRAARKKDNSTIWILAALAAGVAYLMSKGTINIPGPGVLSQAHQDVATAAMMPVNIQPVSNIVEPVVSTGNTGRITPILNNLYGGLTFY